MPRALLLSAAVLASLLLAAPRKPPPPTSRSARSTAAEATPARRYTDDYIELYNRSAAAVAARRLVGPVRLAPPAARWQVTPLNGLDRRPAGTTSSQEAAGAGGTRPLPTPDATGSIAMSATSGKVALVTSTTGLACGTDCDASARDFVGYGAANDFETAAAARRSATRPPPSARATARPTRTTTPPTSPPAPPSRATQRRRARAGPTSSPPTRPTTRPTSRSTRPSP